MPLSAQYYGLSSRLLVAFKLCNPRAGYYMPGKVMLRPRSSNANIAWTPGTSSSGHIPVDLDALNAMHFRDAISVMESKQLKSDQWLSRRVEREIDSVLRLGRVRNNEI